MAIATRHDQHGSPGPSTAWPSGPPPRHTRVSEFPRGRLWPLLSSVVLWNSGRAAGVLFSTHFSRRVHSWVKALKDVAAIVKPETILAWFLKLVAAKFDGTKHRKEGRRPPIDEQVEMLILAMADANPTWGYGWRLFDGSDQPEANGTVLNVV